MDKHNPTTHSNTIEETSDKTLNCSIDAVIIRRESSNTLHLKQRIIGNFLLIWLDANIDKTSTDYQNNVTLLEDIIGNVNTFSKSDECVDFFTEIDDTKVLFLVEDTIGQQILPLIHDIPQLNIIYIFGASALQHKEWTKNLTKIKGTYTDIKTICGALKIAANQCDEDSIVISFVEMSEESSSQNLDQLESTFMYTQIYKEILLQMEYDQQSTKALADYWRKLYDGNESQLMIINEFERDYHPQLSIWWYTRESFTYEMVNRALRTLEADIMINMGFFIRDLHYQIEQLHREQISNYHKNPLIVYRGQGLAKSKFEKLTKTKGVLLSFNNFLSTSTDRDVPLSFAESATANTDMVGILFRMFIDYSISSSPFASIREVSYFQTEDEILFSMHTVFRVGEIKQMNSNNSFYQVELELTSDDDQQLLTLTNYIREEVAGLIGWERLGNLLTKTGHFEKAEELYTVLLEKTCHESEKRNYYNNLGYINHSQGDHKKAICYYENALKTSEESLPLDYPSLATVYNNIGVLYDNLGEYSKALLFLEKGLENREKTLPSNHPSLAASYNNIGDVYDNMGEYSTALSYYEKALAIFENTLPSNHPSLATSYSNIGLIYQNMAEYSKALLFYKKALDIVEKTLPPYHPDLAIPYGNMASLYHSMEEHSLALSFFEKTCEIFEKTLPSDHPSLASSYSNIASLYDHMGEYSNALLFYEKALEIFEKTFSANHPSLATSYNNIASVYYNMGDYSKALSFFEKAFEIRQETLPSNHSSLATSYNNIAMVYQNMEDYSKALSFYQKALEIFEKTLPMNRPSLATSYGNIGMVYPKMGEYSKALSFLRKDIEIRKDTLPSTHPSLGVSYNNIGLVHQNMGEYSEAFSFHKKALEIFEKTLPSNHPSLATSYNNIGEMYQSIGDYSKALSFYEKGLEIRQKTLPSNHPNLGESYKNIASVYESIKEYSKALSYFERALDIKQRSLPPNHSSIQVVQENIETIRRKL